MPQTRASMCEIQNCDDVLVLTDQDLAEVADVPDDVEQNHWNELLELGFHYAIGLVLHDCLKEQAMEKLALSCHFALGVLSM